jgi:PadR family transcriptional regulator, regulatory protein PadR
VLRLMKKKPMSGEDIRLEIEKRKGCKPSPGTIYPVLKSLRASGLIKRVAVEGKVKKYGLTEAGKKELNNATKTFVQIFFDMKEEFKC